MPAPFANAPLKVTSSIFRHRKRATGASRASPDARPGCLPTHRAGNGLNAKVAQMLSSRHPESDAELLRPMDLQALYATAVFGRREAGRPPGQRRARNVEAGSGPPTPARST